MPMTDRPAGRFPHKYKYYFHGLTYFLLLKKSELSYVELSVDVFSLSSEENKELQSLLSTQRHTVHKLYSSVKTCKVQPLKTT